MQGIIRAPAYHTITTGGADSEHHPCIKMTTYVLNILLISCFGSITSVLFSIVWNHPQKECTKHPPTPPPLATSAASATRAAGAAPPPRRGSPRGRRHGSPQHLMFQDKIHIGPCFIMIHMKKISLGLAKLCD